MDSMLSYLVGVDWAQLFTPDTPLLEIVLRGSVVYLALFFLLRIVLRREAVGSASPICSSSCSSPMPSRTRWLASTLRSPTACSWAPRSIFWSYALDWLAYHWAPFGRFMHPPALRLVKDGQLLRANLRKEALDPEDVMAEIRQQGLEDLSHVKAAYLEFDGRMSIIPCEGEQTHKPEERQAA